MYQRIHCRPCLAVATPYALTYVVHGNDRYLTAQQPRGSTPHVNVAFFLLGRTGDC